jgi:3-hydroxyisobutyrate dehydrogenase
MAQAKESVAFLGTGTMGHAMATRALGAGIPTLVWNRDPKRARDLVDLGAEAAVTPAEAAHRSSIVVTMVTDADVVLAIAKDEGMLAALAPGAIWVQMSTIGVAGITRVQTLVEAERPDVVLVDAPVSGSKDPAEQGQLTIFASGPEAVRSRLTPLFDALGRRTVWVGPVGTGSRLKLVANAWLALAAEAVNTAVALARLLGLETESVANALGGGPLVSPWQAAKLDRIAHGDFSAQFALSLALKDVHLALESAGAERFGALACLADEWQEVVDLGLGDSDLTIVAQALERQGASGNSFE